jgi:hypothetical protein
LIYPAYTLLHFAPSISGCCEYNFCFHTLWTNDPMPMQTIHDPDKFIADLRQILSQGRKRIGLLVGAGAPMSIRVDSHGKLSEAGSSLIPGADALTTLAYQTLQDDTQRAAVKTLAETIGGKPNIEQILSQVRLLEKAIGNAKVQGLDSDGYAKLGKCICDAIGKVVAVKLPADRNAYNEIVAWISGTLRTHAVEIFTSNYDLLFEEAFEQVRAPYFDGFTGGAAPFFDPVSVANDDLPARWSRLWKLHGSIGWGLEDGNIVRGRGRGSTQLIFPDHLKYDLTQRQPYTALFERFRQFLLSPDTLLLAIGFSFRDPHISAVIEEALSANANAAAIAFQFEPLGIEWAACRMAADIPNLSVYAWDAAVINGVQGLWRPGEPEKSWQEIRPTFWGPRDGSVGLGFLLGDFVHFARFCALSQAKEMAIPALTKLSTSAVSNDQASP